ncbi:hypothetical protein [Paraliomyxa miuraensis]|uniref:hypothetical protein n=1 Tax=Paraliomyxa miuraensis TaxID=376150 RepID=UPI00224E3C35|nr:hypothetical protein [Paraliomyxa miuraensis]MCX4242609.1 hypothetical protein [Paraliomyxa miuraensis]
MARHRLDLLPLLDVFMVVLFVFATIQEQRLDDTTRDAQRLEERVAQAERALQVARAEQIAESSKHVSAMDEAQAQAQDLRRELLDLQHALHAQRDEARRTLARAGVSEQAVERIELLSKVLEKYGVVEIDLVADGEEGELGTRCCYRSDPLSDDWRSCGRVPARLEDRAVWLDGGAGGLVDALRRTKGGNAMTLVRQHEHEAGYRIAQRLAEQLRERFTDQHVVAEVEPDLVLRCAD